MLFRATLSKENAQDTISEILSSVPKLFNWIVITLMANNVLDADTQLKEIQKNTKKEDIELEFKIGEYFIKIDKIAQCDICLGTEEDNIDDWSELKCCKSKIHKQCKKSLLASTHSRCPNCNEPLGNEDNTPPFGSMTITKNSGCSAVFKGKQVNLILINYQLNYGTINCSRGGYIPDTEEGNLLLDRLINAFKLGYVFKIGDSLTTQTKNTIVWGGIHHKTELSGHFGFPDDTYFDRLNTELKGFNVLGSYKGDLKKGKRVVYDNR